jgi:hypothetical protein
VCSGSPTRLRTPLGLIAGVRDGAVDVAVVSLPVPTKGLRVTLLEAQALVVALPTAEARWHERGVALASLAPDRLVMLNRAANPALHDAVIAHCRAARIAPALVEAVEPRVEAVLLAVAAGDGAALLPASVGDCHAVPGVQLVELLGEEPDPGVGRRHACCRRRTAARPRPGASPHARTTTASPGRGRGPSSWRTRTRA